MTTGSLSHNPPHIGRYPAAWRAVHDHQRLPQSGYDADLDQRSPSGALRQGDPGNLGCAHLLLHGRSAGAVFLQAGAVRHPGAGDRRPADHAFLHHLQLAFGALQLLHHHQAGAGRQGLELAARQPQGRRRGASAWAGGPVQCHRFPHRQGAVSFRWCRHHAGDVDGALVLRHQCQCRHGLRAQRSFAEGHHLPARAGAHGGADQQLQPARHLREARSG